MDSPARTVLGDCTNLSSRSPPSPHKQPQSPVCSLLDLGCARGSRRALRLGSYTSPAPVATARTNTPRRQNSGRRMAPAVSPTRGDETVGEMELQPSAVDPPGGVKLDSSCTVLEGDSMRSISFCGASGSPYRRLADRPSLNASLGRSLNDSWAFYRAFEPAVSSSGHQSRSLVINPTKSVLTIDARTSQILTWNSIAAELLGYTAEELGGLRLKQLLATAGDGSTRPQLEETHLCSDAGGLVVFPGTVVELSRKHGAPVAVSLWLRKVNSDAGQRRRCVAVIEPVHRQSVKLECSLNGEMDGCSGSAAKFFCLDGASTDSLSILQLLPSLQLPADTSLSLNQCLSTQNIAGCRPDGSSFPVSVSLSVLPSIAPSTSAQQSDRLLIQVHTYTSLMGLVVINDRLQIVDCNRTFISLTAGYERSALIGQDVRQLIVTFDEDMEMLDSSSDEFEDPLFTDCVYDSADIYIEPEQTEERLSVHTQADLTSTHLPPSHSSSGSNILRPQTEECFSSSPTNLRPQTDEHSSSSPTLSRPQTKEHSSSSSTFPRPQTKEHSSSSPTLPRPQTEEFDQTCPIECDALSKSPCVSRCDPALLTSTPGSTRCSTAPRTSDRAVPHTQCRDGTYYGMARHSDGSQFGITYDLCAVRLENGVLLYCLWIGQDRPQQPSQPAADEETSSRLKCAAAGSAVDVDDAPHTAGEYSRYYTTVKQIGNGAFGLVKLSYRNGDRLLVVTKFIRKSKVSLDHWVEDSTLGKVVPLEVSLLAMLRHKNIIGVLDVFENVDYVQLVMERHGCMDLFEFIERDPKLDEALISYIFRQICSAVEYLHQLEIVHRDVKDENVIIDSQFCVKLIDFGSATFVTRGALLNVFCGTLEYCAPEVLAGNKYDGYVMEMWSLGVTLYTTICGQNPFSDVLDILSQPLSLPSNLSSGLTDLLSGLLDKDPVRRMSMATLMEHPWVSQSVDIGQYIFSDVVQCSGQELDPARFLSPSRVSSVSGCCESAVRTPDIRRRISQSGSPDITARPEQRCRVRSDETHFRSVEEHCSVNLHESMYR